MMPFSATGLLSLANPIVRVAPTDAARAVEAIHEHGFVIVEGAVPHEPLAVLRRRMDEDTVELLRYCESIGGNPRALGHLQQGPPVSSDLVFADVAMNAAVNEVCRALYGAEDAEADARPLLTFYNGNTNCPGSVEQHLHMDGRHFTAPGEPVATTTSVVVNIPPRPTSLYNGAIELWPGSHRIHCVNDAGTGAGDAEGASIASLSAERRKAVAPVRPETEVGDVLIRDVRLWHRGVPNRSDRPRHMIALIVTKRVAGAPVQRLRFERGCEAALEGHGVDANADYVEEPIDYLIAPTRRIHERHYTRA